ncbi:hypothetical protein EIP86_004411 [Pleurotus ostreatoroseus]|nr:hypothetical protein EIP86_004411 [Pleurotus ostreatoroseus]
MLEQKLNEEITSLHDKVKTLSDGDYATAKADVDRLRKELGQEPLPSIQTLLEEKTSTYLKELRLHIEAQKPAGKRGAEDAENPNSGKRPRGRPKGSRNSNKKKAEGKDGAEGTPAPTA